MLDLPDIAIGAIMAALIASLFSFLGLVISKEQKTSEFRQAWIDSLRQELSQFIATAKAIHASTVKETSEDSERRYRPTSADIASLDGAAASIRLRLNPDEDLPKRVLREISEINKILNGIVDINYSKLKVSEDQLISEASLLLKSEWNRVKKGEFTYRAAKFFVLISALCFLALAGFSFFGADDADPISGEVKDHIKNDAAYLPD